ncbi:hypothetical protein [Methylocella sp.]|uniref:hypothetical protein n=1 Tax=Methylocella sp. TaxID=1978226 RepID=UPI0035B21801
MTKNFKPGRWFWAFLKRYLLFTLAVIGATRAYSWLFGYDAEVMRWTVTHRPLTAVILTCSAVLYAAYDLLQEEDR